MRTLTSGVIAELRKSLVRPFLLVDAQFADNWLHVWTGIGPITIGGITYTGLGSLLSISAISETAEVQANGVTLSVSGVPSSIVGESLAQCRQGLPVSVSLGFVTDTGVVVADPIILLKGNMDTATVDEGVDNCTLSVTVESNMADLQRSRVRRFTDDDQQRTSPGDVGFQYVPMIQDWNGPWGYTKD